MASQITLTEKHNSTQRATEVVRLALEGGATELTIGPSPYQVPGRPTLWDVEIEGVGLKTAVAIANLEK